MKVNDRLAVVPMALRFFHISMSEPTRISEELLTRSLASLADG
jgi:hypothetical protein